MSDWRDDLPEVRGSYRCDAALSKSVWFQVGGMADVLFKPDDADDLANFLQQLNSDIPVTVLGVGSNILVRDGGVRGVVVRLGRGFAGIEVNGNRVSAGAGALSGNVAKVAQQHGLTGLEFLIGIPGTIGGNVAMNAGAYGHEVKDSLVEVHAVSRSGKQRVFTNDEMGFGYRHHSLDGEWIFTQAVFEVAPGDAEAIEAEMLRIVEERTDSQPVRARTGGSTFTNPPGKKAWELIDAAGCRGLSMGGAQVSQKHCNFLINNGDATAADLEALCDEVHDRVLKDSGVDLHREIKVIGE